MNTRSLCILVVTVALAAATAQAVTYQFDGGNWSQQPPTGEMYSMISGECMFGSSSGLFAFFSVQATKLDSAVPSSRPGYEWETPYDGTGLLLSLGGDPANDISDSTFELVNYNNNENGLPSEFLMVCDGVADNGTTYYVEAYWNADANPATITSERISGEFTSGFIIIGENPIPEPATMVALIMGVGGLTRYIRKR